MCACTYAKRKFWVIQACTYICSSTFAVGLGLLCTILGWEYFSNSLGCGEHFTRVRVTYTDLTSHLAWYALYLTFYTIIIFFMVRRMLKDIMDPCTKIYAFTCYCRLLQAAISGFSSFFPDYQERTARHEAAHFLSTLCSFNTFTKYSDIHDSIDAWWANTYLNFSCLFAWPPYPGLLTGHWKRACQSHWWKAGKVDIQWPAWCQGIRQVLI